MDNFWPSEVFRLDVVAPVDWARAIKSGRLGSLLATCPASCSALMGTVDARCWHWLATSAAFTAKVAAWGTSQVSGGGRWYHSGSTKRAKWNTQSASCLRPPRAFSVSMLADVHVSTRTACSVADVTLARKCCLTCTGCPRVSALHCGRTGHDVYRETREELQPTSAPPGEETPVEGASSEERADVYVAMADVARCVVWEWIA